MGNLPMENIFRVSHVLQIISRTFKGTVMQIKKALINDPLHVSKVF